MSTPSWRVDLPSAGRPVLVAGGGGPALGPVAALRATGAVITVVAPSPDAALVDLADRGLLTLHRRSAVDADVRAAWVVVAVSGHASEDARVEALSDAQGRVCLRPDTAGGAGPAAPGDPSAAPGGAGPGEVVLVGGGPGDPGLITVAGAAALRAADVVITDRLAPLALLADLGPGVLVVDVSKVPGGGPTTGQDEINRLLVEHALAGRRVVRLKGGDPFVFGRGAEEWQACAEQGIPVRVIPGVTSAVAVPALAGIPVTHRDANQGFTVVSGHVAPGDPRCRLDYAALARSGTALVVLMGVGTLAAITRTLTDAGLDPTTPAATVADGGLPGQRTVHGTVGTIADLTATAGIRPPAITVIGSIAAFSPTGSSAGPGG